MRHWLATVVTIGIAVLLILGASLFAWMRSAQLVLSTESGVLERYEPAATNEFDWITLGAKSYRANCMMCHGVNGRGWDQYPGLGHAAEILRAEGGREFLIDVHLHGLTSPRWRAPMPPMRHMQDVELAAVINHVLNNFGNSITQDQLVMPEEIAARREPEATSREVNQRRPANITPDGADRMR
jgi:mono/diheme cytochrome c family protein